MTIVFVRRTNTEDKGVTIPRTKKGPRKGAIALIINHSSDLTTAFILRIQLTDFG